MADTSLQAGRSSQAGRPAPLLRLEPVSGAAAVRALGRCDALVIGVTAAPAPAGQGRRGRPGQGSAGDVSSGPLSIVGGAGVLPPDVQRQLAALLTAQRTPTGVGKVSRVGLLVGGSGLPAQLITVGLGPAPESDWSTDALRQAAGVGIRAAGQARQIALRLPVAGPMQAGAAAEGALLGGYRFTPYRSCAPAPVDQQVHLILDRVTSEVRTALARAQTIARAVCAARDLVNTPGADLRPADVVTRARRLLRGRGVTIEVLNESALAQQGYGGLIGVGQGSDAPPRLLRMAYQPPGAAGHLGLVGKGITFDTGGYSLKPAKPMLGMKGDMAGAAAVISAVLAISELGLPVRVTGYAALAENMVSARSIRPGDVLTIYGGRTVEVLNTDAEGRLVLADVLVRAQADSPDLLVDLATLTGAAVVALGHRTAGVMGSSDAARARVLAAAAAAGEEAWGMPIPPELRAGLESTVADLANVSASFDPAGGMLRAASFLAEFITPGQEWVHCDIAGPAMNDGAAWGCTPAGGTGFGVRTLVALAESVAQAR